MIWAFGFLWFAIALPQPAPVSETDAVVVPTGSGGRIARGLELLRAGASDKLLVTGVYEDVKQEEFAAVHEVPAALMDCCVTLGFAALDTRGNARETADWAESEGVNSIRLVTSDWHMRRVVLELRGSLPGEIFVLRDAVRSEPSFWMLFVEYHKLLAAWLVRGFPV